MEKLIQILSRLPGLGHRSARRIALYLLRHREGLMLPLADALRQVAQDIRACEFCGNFDMISPCQICTDTRREEGTLCVVEDLADLWAIERANIFRGRYHVLGGALSAIDGRGPEQLGIGALVERVKNNAIHEVILATNATVEGQATAHYITDALSMTGIKISRLAFGIPIGGELDYLDDGTLATALAARQAV